MTREVPPSKAPPGARLSVKALQPSLRAVVAVAGATSNTGKTRLVERIVAALTAAGVPTLALKVTRTHLSHCPRGHDACGTCDSLAGPFEVVRAMERLAVPGKDTGRYVAAGATKTRWLLARPDAMADGIRAAVSDPPEGAVLVAEGNSFLDWAECDLALMAWRDREAPKASAHHVMDRIDAFVPRPDRDGRLVGPPGSAAPILSDADLWPFVAGRLRLTTAGTR